MLRTLFPASLLAALILAAPAQAQPGAAPQGSAPIARTEVAANGRVTMHVNGVVLADLAQFVPDEAKRATLALRLVLLAKQEAIGTSCAAFAIDQPRLAATMMRTMQPLSDGVSKDRADAHLNRALRQYHTLLGSELAQYSYDPSAYCAYAPQAYDDLASDPADQSLLVLKRS